MKYILPIIVSLLLLNIVYSAEGVDIQINQTKYDPYPAEPGSYVTVWFELYNGGRDLQNVQIELLPEFPFSFDSSDNASREIHDFQSGDTAVYHWKMKVAQNAVPGANDIEIQYVVDGNTYGKKSEIYVNRSSSFAELKSLLVEADPLPYPGGETVLSVDVINIAPGDAQYTIVKAETPIGSIKVNEKFVGTLESDDFDTVDFSVKINEDAAPGRYPLIVTTEYKDEYFNTVAMNSTVYFDVYTESYATKDLKRPVPWYYYALGALAAVIGIWKFKLIKSKILSLLKR